MKTTILTRFILFNNKLFQIFCLIMLVHSAALSQNAVVRFGNSYVNLSKNKVGGTVEPGDTLEIRTTFYISSSYNPTGNQGKIYKVRYFDNLPSHTDTIHDSLRLVTNEGMTFRRYTQAPGDDPGSIVKTPAFPGDYQVRINMGGNPFNVNPTAPGGADPMGIASTSGASDIKAGTTASSNRPIFAGGMLVSTSFRVVVTGAYGDTVVLGAGKVVFRNSTTTSTDTALSATQYKILISKPVTLCSSSTGTNFAAEAGGTFDHAGTLNRSYGPTFLIPNYTYLPNSGVSPLPTINDGYYAIVNNISPVSSTFTGARLQPNCNIPSSLPNNNPNSCFNREFGGFWYISGDHTGTSNAAGNAPPALGTDAGYMLLVNADLATSEAYHQTITGLCPSTYYQFSAWIKNVCPVCGIDTNGTQTYKPGVLPNVTFVVDNLDRISSGQLDTVGWQKRGFVLLTGPTQTSITISIRNNAPGGGGNDWALDDITLATCPPDLLLTPNRPDTLCQGADDTVRFKIASYVDNYTQWKLEQSTDGGTIWNPVGIDTAGQAGSGSVVPVFNPGSGQYENIVSRYFRILPTNTLIKYRIIVASTVANLANASCNFTTNSPKIVRGVDCMAVLPVELIYFRGQVKDGLGNLQWLTANETADIVYIIERSNDGTHFSTIASVNGRAGAGQGAGYQLTDPVPVNGQVYYRINLTSGSYHRYSSQILLSNSAISFSIKSAVNPFTDHISINLTAPGDGPVAIDLVDMYGRTVKQLRQNLNQGLNDLTLYGLGGLSNGTYALRVRYADQVVSKKMLKMVKL
ncbi:MAG TPA: T9SS type A sorting domain-containing protein [Puia sp.]|nr:T9SS type A sorting domain-containing protein [Puia sp.]